MALVEFSEALGDDETQYSELPSMEDENRIKVEDSVRLVPSNVTFEEDDDPMDEEDDSNDEENDPESVESVGITGRDSVTMTRDSETDFTVPCNFIRYERLIQYQQLYSTGAKRHPHMHTINLHAGITLTDVFQFALLSNGLKFFSILATKHVVLPCNC